jgi:hypothetical protein
MWLCPFCSDGMLQRVAGSFVSHETRASERMHDDPNWEVEWVSSTFTSWLRCNACKEPVAVMGTSSPEWDQESESMNDYVEMCKPLATQPMLPPLALPSQLPESGRTELEASFRLVWLDPDASANRLRVSMERLLDHLRIKRRVRNAKGKFDELNLHNRITLYETKEPRLGGHLMAVKWLGNTASHQGGVSREALLDAFEVLEDTLAEMLVRRSAAVTKLAKKLTRKYKPKKRR